MSTRRQSSRLAQPAKAKEAGPSKSAAKPGKKATKRKIVDEDVGEVSEEPEDDVESDASEFAKRPAKRQKSTKAAKSAAKPSRKQALTGDGTCHLTAIPLDVVLEIFGYLEPKDIIHLSRTNHLFRSHLLSPESSGVWKAAREKMDGPDPHADFSEQRWAHLLYGHARCQSCGTNNVHQVNFVLRRRACAKCQKANLVVTSSFASRFPDLDIKILDLLPYTNVGGFARGRSSKSNFYWRTDIEEMAETVAAYELDVEVCVDGAEKKLEDFIAERVALVDAVVKHAAVCSNWAKEVAGRRRQEAYIKANERFNLIKQRLITLGHDEEDINAIAHRRTSVSQSTPLTDRVWNKLLGELEPLIRTRKAERFEAARKHCVHNRTLVAGQIYNEYKKTLVPDQWRFLPGLYDVCQLPVFRTVLDAPGDASVELADFEEAAGALPAFTSTWPTAHKDEILQLIKDAPGLHHDPSSNTPLSALATIIFKCEQPSCRSRFEPNSILIGWNAAVSHRCVDNGHYAFGNFLQPASVETIVGFSERGSRAVAALVSLAGLDEKQTTTAEMDALELRFLCLTCHPQTIDKTDNYLAMSWREAVSHFTASSWLHEDPVWHKLTPAETQQVINDEGPDQTLSWACNHCSHYLNDYDTFDSVVDHVKASHAIADPSPPSDLFRGVDLLKPQPITFTPPLRYHCQKCTSPASKAFDLDVLKAHMQSEHQIANPVSGKDWKKLKAT
ncbi:hypothetical protein C8R46DRAFT_379942 [Mycena filopes]|nr:hypothetical protein C8R46DRAFT_379942 [Mycena filopes]